MSLPKFRSAPSFEALINQRRQAGFLKYAVTIRGQKVDRALFMDTSWEALEELADAVVYLTFEVTKLESKGFRAEARRLTSLIKALESQGEALFAYRGRLRELAPDLLKEGDVK